VAVQAAVTVDTTLPAPSLSRRYQRLRGLELASALVMGGSAVAGTATSIALFKADNPGTALAAIVLGGGSTAGLYAVGLPSLWTTVSLTTRRLRHDGIPVNRAPLFASAATAALTLGCAAAQNNADLFSPRDVGFTAGAFVGAVATPALVLVQAGLNERALRSHERAVSVVPYATPDQAGLTVAYGL